MEENEDELSPIEQTENFVKETLDFPLYFVVDGINVKGSFTPAYYKVEGPNGPVWFMNPGRDKVHSTTMYDFAMEAQSDSFRQVKKEETPFDCE